MQACPDHDSWPDMDHFADRLVAAIRRKGNALCVGLDPRWDSLPNELQKRHADVTLTVVAAAYEEFCNRVLDIVAPLVPVVKPQSAFFEACGPDGLRALQNVLKRARERGLMTILDSKRNDIAATAEAYADAAFAGVRLANQLRPVWDADALTVNPYLGRDALEPFLHSARRSSRGVFVLVRTSNPGAGQFQDLNCGGRPLFYHVADAVGAWTCENLGQCGFGDVGAVVGATGPDELAGLRLLLPQTVFLVPGFGAQGATAADCAGAFREDGLGTVINSSRGIIFAFQPQDTGWEARIEAATRSTMRALAEATPMGRLGARVEPSNGTS
ncbi:MAG TPA: orotidine-5'-phosphate decarboxylase [Gemmataceae bacterium]|nr:orotidine-5'-phosphate decarboxylase [Gemmataceae bacterium]